jgi:mono/diheme cytochrome c family protein
MRLPPSTLIVGLLAGLLLAYTGGPVRAQGPGSAERGAKLYAENCAVCHGDQGQGRIGATLRQNWPSIAPDQLIRATITDGVPGSLMPAWSQTRGGPLGEQDINDIVAYIQTWLGNPLPLPTLRPAPVATVTPPPGAIGDPVTGAQIYVSNCAMCHGQNGEGRIGVTLAKQWPAIQVDQFLRQTIASGVPGSLMPAWGQAKGGPLTDQQIDDVEVYIRTLPVPARSIPEPKTTGPGSLGLVLGGLVVLAVVAVVFSAVFGRRPDS